MMALSKNLAVNAPDRFHPGEIIATIATAHPHRPLVRCTDCALYRVSPTFAAEVHAAFTCPLYGKRRFAAELRCPKFEPHQGICKRKARA